MIIVSCYTAAVEECLRFGLVPRKSLKAVKEAPTFDLLKDVAKTLPEARAVIRRVQDIDEANGAANTSGLTFDGKRFYSTFLS